MSVHEWIATPFDMEIYDKRYEFHLEDELIAMHIDHEAKALFKSKTSPSIEAMSILLLSSPS